MHDMPDILPQETAPHTPDDDERVIDEAYRDLLNGYLASNHRKKVKVIDRAFRFARHAHAGVRRRSGEPYILHPIAVARIVSQEIGLGSTSICAALLHDVVEDTDYTVEDIEQQFGHKTARIVEGLTKISGGIFGDKASAQAENFRKLLLTMSEDIRVVLIKMADRLHNMRTLGSMPVQKQYKIAGETLYIYAPLAHRLGLFAIKTQLEDLAFKYEHPAAWNEITDKIKQSQARRSAVYGDFSTPIKERLDQMGLQYETTARLKSCYSIWKKMQAKHVPFEEVYDLYAMRIIFECDDPALEKELCWRIYSAITDLYRLHPERTRDWISNPKANGYRALHLTVMGPDGNWIEVQIRSRRMDEIAEKGFAAHWIYKNDDAEEEKELTNWLRTIKDILDHPEPSAIDFLDNLNLNLFASEIVVFTPKGELITLPAGATVLDMAFALHTQLGLHCIAAKVNHRLVGLSHRLESGDQVEILTSQTQQPKPEWLEHVNTAKARTRLRAALRKQAQPIIKRGNEILTAFLADNGIEPTARIMDRLQTHFKADSRDDLAYRTGNGQIVPDATLALMLRGGTPDRRLFRKFLAATKSVLTLRGMGDNNDAADTGTSDTATHENTPGQVDTHKVYELCYDGATANFRMADCCSPIAGDDVLGFVDDDGQVTVHAINCPRALVLKAAYGPRIVATRWANVRAAQFEARIQVRGIDRQGILREITSVIASQQSIDLRRLEIKAHSQVFDCHIWINVHRADTVTRLCQRLARVDGVDEATRIS